MNKLWYKNAVFYELYVKAYKDSNNDGKGDFQGLISKLDYLRDLGIDCVWLLPTSASPGKDDGYDVSDYCAINSDYGELKDFLVLVDEMHKRDLKVIVELVLNHTSDQHVWFQEAKKGESSKYYNYYVWSDTMEKYKDARIIFKDTEVSNWTWCSETKKYYWHRFFSHQPDLNYDNPEVHEEIKKIIKFWLDLGVDGFRFDAVPYLYQREGTNCENLTETHDFIKGIRKYIDENYENRIILAEANQWPEDLLPYFGNGDEFHMAYNFPIMPRMYMALRKEHHGPIVDIFNRLPKIPDNCQWAIFLRNHDELTLEMCTDEERDYMYREYAEDKRMKINMGIRRRLAPLLENDRRAIELLYIMLLSFPGAPIIYYGDEIGMGDNIYLGDRNGVRTPMQWNDNKNAGFSNAIPSKLYAPVINDPEYNYNAINVEYQQNNKHSLLYFLKTIIKKRKQYKVFESESIDFIFPENKKVLVFTREFEDQKMLFVFNLSKFSQSVEIDLAKFNGFSLVEVFGNSVFPKIGETPYILTLNRHGYFWFNIQI